MRFHFDRYAKLLTDIQRTVNADRAVHLLIEGMLVREELDALAAGKEPPERTSERIANLAERLREAGLVDLHSILDAEREGIERLRAGDPELLDPLGLTE